MEFEKKGITFTVRYVGQGEFILRTSIGTEEVARAGQHPEAGWAFRIAEPSRKLNNALFGDGKKRAIMLTTPIAKQAAEQARVLDAQRKAERERKQMEERMEAMKRPIKLRYHDGEYLSGWEPASEVMCGLLFDLGLTKYVEGWGWLVDQKAVDALGTEFSYEAAVEFAKGAEAPKDEGLSKHQLAKELGHRVEIRRWLDECDGSQPECDMDQVIQYALPDGGTEVERIHLH